MLTVMISKRSLHQGKERAEDIIGFRYGRHLKLLSRCFFFLSFQNMLEIISKHASDACIFSFTYNLIPGILPRYLTSYQSRQDRVCFLTTSPLQLRTVTTRLRRLRPASLTPKEVRNSQLFPPPRGLAENPTPCVSRLWLQL